MTWRPWRQAMTEALYGDDGFYRRPAGPAAHFRTSVHASPLFAEALARLAHAVAAELGDPAGFTIVDVGAGRGELLRALIGLVPAQWRLVGVEVVDRPADLPPRIEWRRGLDELEPVPYGLLVANEWLDNIPLDVLVDGRLLEVDDDGEERAGPAPTGRDLDWSARHAPAYEGRVELGWPRDDAWAAAVAKVGAGLAVAIDYTVTGAHGPYGTLTGFRSGREVPPVPDGSCDLTAHVLLEACAEAAGAPAVLMTQRQALMALGLSAARPSRELAGLDPGGYLRGLASASEAAELLDPDGLGRFGWLLHPRGVEVPLLDAPGAARLGRDERGPDARN